MPMQLAGSTDVQVVMVVGLQANKQLLDPAFILGQMKHKHYLTPHRPAS